MRTFFRQFFEKIRGYVPRYPAISVGLPSAVSPIVIGSGPGAPTDADQPWPVASRWFRTDGTSWITMEYVRLPNGPSGTLTWTAIPIGNDLGQTIEVDQIDENTPAHGVLVDGCLIKDGKAADALAADLADEATKLVAAAFYTSAVITATGAPQNHAHGMGAAPRLFVVEVKKGHDGAGAGGDKVPEVTRSADGTNVTVTATAGCEYIVSALK